jgi:hypothetical protein
MTLDEAIKHCEEVAERLENSCKRDWMGEDDKRCAFEHRQLAEWLRELQEYRKLYTCHNCYNASASFSDYPCCECRRCFKALDGIKDHYEEVNADERREL